MSNKELKTIQQSILDALDRVQSRLIGLYSGHNLILKTIKIALDGNEELECSLSRLNNNLQKVGMDTQQYFLSIMFLNLISEMEIYLSSLIQIVVSEHPKKLGSVSFKLSEVIDSESIDELIGRASDDFINKLMYKKPMEYLESICDLLSIDMNNYLDLWPTYVEAKARRDLGIHNSWVCNTTYLRKVKEATIKTNAKQGDLMFPYNDKYIDELVDNLGKLVFRIAEALGAKYAQQGHK